MSALYYLASFKRAEWANTSTYDQVIVSPARRCCQSKPDCGIETWGVTLRYRRSQN